MHIREYSLPAGWFPRDPGSVSAFLSEFTNSSNSAWSRAAVAPHAGWYYCGRIAARAVSSLRPEAETVVVLGGHLPGGTMPLFAMEDAVRTPFGNIPIDKEFRSILMNELDGAEDRFRDNTVEVLLPMVHYFFPKANLIWLRLGADSGAFEAGRIISKAAAKLKLKINVLASTDLTHYGPNYGFSPHGTGQAALRWVRDENDAKFLKALETGNSGEVLRSAELDHCACSAGAVLGAMGFASAEGLGNAQLIEYGTSADVGGGTSADSFVGYAALRF